MASFLKNIKDKLIETNDSNESLNTDELDAIRKAYSIPSQEVTESIIEEEPVDLESSDNDTLIADIYSNMDLDVNKSIFKIEELKSTLPGNLPTETKKQTVLGMLPVVGLELDNVVQDADRRLAVLTTSREHNSKKISNLIINAQDEITKYEAEIESLKAYIQEQKKLEETITETINKEISKIEAIKSFIL